MLLAKVLVVLRAPVQRYCLHVNTKDVTLPYLPTCQYNYFYLNRTCTSIQWLAKSFQPPGIDQMYLKKLILKHTHTHTYSSSLYFIYFFFANLNSFLRGGSSKLNLITVQKCCLQMYSALILLRYCFDFIVKILF